MVDCRHVLAQLTHVQLTLQRQSNKHNVVMRNPVATTLLQRYY
jgi:hypothetical protein